MTDSPTHRTAPLWQPIVRVLTGIEIALGVICMTVILALVFLQSAQRYLPIAQVAWTGEVSRFCLVWLTFSAAGLLITMRGHITLEIVDAARSRLFVRIVQSGAMLIVAAIAIMLVVEAIALIESQGILKSAVLRIPMSWVYIPVLVGVASTAIRSLIQAVRIAVVGPMFTDVDDDAEVAA